jgi:O-antigen/teichoic acid export membrane protein
LNSKSSQSSPRFVASTISLGMVSVFTMALALAGTVIITRHFSVEEFGIYTLVLIFVSLLLQISNFGLDLSIPKFITGVKEEHKQEQYFNTAVLFRFGTILLASFFAWIGSPYIKLLFGQSLLPGFFLFVPLLYAVDSFRGLLGATLQGCFLFTKTGIVNSVSSALFLILVILVTVFNGEITLLILARVISSLVACILALFFIPIKKRLFFKMDIFVEFIKFGYPLQINSILGFIYTRVDTIAVAVYLHPVDIAFYEVARKIPDSLRSLYDPFISVYFPFVSKRYSLEGRGSASELLNQAVRFVAFVTLLGAAIAILFGREILVLVFSDKYSSIAPVFILFMFNLSIALISNVMGNTLVAAGDTKKPPIINFFNAIASWLGTILFIPSLALIGATIANTFGTAVALPLNRYFLQKKTDLKDTEYIKPLGLFGIWTALFYLISPESMLIKIAFLVAYFLASYFLSIITIKDITQLAEGSGIFAFLPFNKLRLWFSKL